MGAVLLVIVVSLASVAVEPAGTASSDARSHAGLSTLESEDGAPLRPVYRYSIVRGGVYSPRELVDAMAADRVVADHYKGMVVTAAQVERVRAPRRAYMSYRVGNRVFWTKQPVALSEGEAVLSDGTTEIRARCGNRISDTPMEPTLEVQPAVLEFDRVMAPEPRFNIFDPAEALAVVPLGAISAAPAPPGGDPSTAAAAGPGPSGSGPDTPGAPLLPGGVVPPFGPPGGSVVPPGGPIVPPSTREPIDPDDPVPPPDSIPEPGMLLLLGAGLLAYGIGRRAP